MYIKVKKKKIDFSFFNCIITNTKNKMRFHEQMKKLRNEEEQFDNIFPHYDWTLQDFKDLFCMIEEGYLVQEESYWFIINEVCDRDVYKEQFEEFEANCIVCNDYMSDVEEEDYNEGANNICDNCCSDEEKEDEEQCKMCSKQNEMVLSLDKDEDPKCNECGDKYEWNETDMSYSKKSKN